jgi:hypothetical protein
MPQMQTTGGKNVDSPETVDNRLQTESFAYFAYFTTDTSSYIRQQR